jgi:hypothetical protein
MTGSAYSGTTLVRKLGLKHGSTFFVHGAPEAYFDWLFPLPESLKVRTALRGPLDFVHLFELKRSSFEKHFLQAKKVLSRDGVIWISWPKKSSGVSSELDENIIRDFGLEQGLVDVKVCAVNEIWSGLKFVFRKKDR